MIASVPRWCQELSHKKDIKIWQRALCQLWQPVSFSELPMEKETGFVVLNCGLFFHEFWTFILSCLQAVLQLKLQLSLGKK